MGIAIKKHFREYENTFVMLNLPQNFEVTVIPSGCCGMAGSFGYEKEHYEVSMQIGEQTLFPAVRKASEETIIAAPGTSCRHQIFDGTGKKASASRVDHGRSPAEITFSNLGLKNYICSKSTSMAGNSFGKLFKLTTFGESHGEAIGGIIDGCPAGLKIDLEKVQQEMDRRKPGQSAIVTQRKEPDSVKFLSGIFEGKTTGTPIGFIIENANQKSKDYSHIKDVYRPSHADYTYDQKYGNRDYRGGGRSSARETACRVAAGAIAKQLLGGYQDYCLYFSGRRN